MRRRDLLVNGGLFSVLAARGYSQMVHLQQQQAPPLVDPGKLEPFVDRLPIPEVAKPVQAAGKRLYRMAASEFYRKVHRDLEPTRFWGYGGSVPGPTIEVRSGEEISVEWRNQLPAKHFLPIDRNLMGADMNAPDSRMVVHVHGAKVPPGSDGWPEDWYVPGKFFTYRYPNQQDAALLWYHDHAMGINRLNICAGMAGLYIVRDRVEDALNLPQGEFEIPLVLMDRLIRKDGQIYYPVSQRAEAPWVPEYFGNAVLINGTLLPYLEVQPRKYRFRVLNASNGRFYFLSFSNSQALQQIGSDQGLLPELVKIARLDIVPGERADVVVDFADHAGERILLNDLSSSLMQIRVASERVEDKSSLPATLRPVPKTAESTAILTRRLTLEELDNVLAEPMTHLLDGKRWNAPISEKPVLGTTEIWEFLNVTDDSHPIHLHLVRFQILDRRPIDVTALVWDKKLIYTGDPVKPEANESGWKDTVRVTPGSSTRIIVTFVGYTGKYVWHCHILEHEDNEMMRPYEVVAPPRAK